mgnify:FL=1
MKTPLAAVVILAMLVLIRWRLEPRQAPYVAVNLNIAQQERVIDLSRSKVSLDQLADQLKSTRVLLIGEDHFYRETVSYFLQLLSKLHDRPLVVLLELPNSRQRLIDQYFSSGTENIFDEIWDVPDVALPYYEILRWSFQNRQMVRSVLAIDENRAHIRLMRFLLTDTRNQTIADSIEKSYREFPEARIVFYGGQAHTLRKGRYLFDVANREAAGARLARTEIPPYAVKTLILSGGRLTAIDPIFPGVGAMMIDSASNELPVGAFLSFPFF